MIKYTTPTLTYKLPFTTDFIKEAFITIKSPSVKIEKSLKECKVGENTIAVTLTQEETASFKIGETPTVMLNVLTANNKRLATEEEPLKDSVKRNLKEGVINDT
jgi:hypothetical protein